MLDRAKKINVPLRLGNLIFVSVLLCISVNIFSAIIHIRPISVLHVVIGFYLVILCIGWLRSCVHYTFTKEYLISNFLGIPFRKIRWNNIGHAVYVHAWKDIVPRYSMVFGGIVPNLSNTYGQIIYVTLKGRARFIPSCHIRFFHNIIHPFHTACIWLPDASRYKYIDAFKECYPELELQPLDAWKTM